MKDPRTEEEMIHGVRQRLIEAIRLRLRADVKVGVALSGGIDSSVIAGIVCELIKEGEQVGGDKVTNRLSCFGIGFEEDSGYDESAVAKRTADHLGVKFFRRHMSEQAIADDFEDATWVCEQPYPDLNFIGCYALSQLVHEEGFRVILNGQGSDEILGGYAIFLPDFVREPDTTFEGPTLSESDRKELCEMLEKEAPQFTLTKSDASLPKSAVARRQLNNTSMSGLMLAAFPSLPFRPWVNEAFGRSDPQLTYAENIPGPTLAKIQHKWHPLHTAEYLFSVAHLPNLLLGNLGDRGEMAHSIEGRTPFLDHKLTEYVNNLPPSMKIRRDNNSPSGFVEKYVLKEAAKPFVTEEIYKKRKQPYAAPDTYPKGGPVHKMLRKWVDKGEGRSTGLFGGNRN